MWVVGAIVVAVIIIGGIWWMMAQNNTVVSPTTSNTTTTTTTPLVDNSIDSTTPAGKISYQNALKLYGDRRIQFDSTCQSIPNDVTFKVGTTIMLDNRSAKARIISLDNVNYSIRPYGYIIVTLNTSAALPHTVSVDCGKGENQGRILLQR